MKLIASLVFAALAAGCGTSNKLIHAEAPQDGQQGIRIALDGGNLLAGTQAVLENVGSYTSIPTGWQGPVPPGWTRPDVPPATPPQPPPP